MHKVSAALEAEAPRCHVAVFAGAGDAGFKDGKAVSAHFRHPTGLGVARDGTVIIADSRNHSLRRVAGGEVTTVKLDALKLRRPSYVAIDQKSGDLIVSDTDNHRLVMVRPDGSAYVLAGDGCYGFRDGFRGEASFRGPTGIVLRDNSAKDGIFVADTFNHRIRKIDAEGNVTTLCGFDPGSSDGDLQQASFSHPVGLCFDRHGNLFVCDTGNFRIRKITPQGMVSTVCGSLRGHRDGSLAEAQFGGPVQVAISSRGYMYANDGTAHAHSLSFVADNDPPCIRRITPTGQVTTLAGLMVGNVTGLGHRARFTSVTDIAVSEDGDLLVADELNHALKRVGLAEDEPALQ